jgi:hypothetical protein
MPISKKAKIQREHKAAEKAGTRAPVKANGLPVKAPKPTSIVHSPYPLPCPPPSARLSVPRKVRANLFFVGVTVRQLPQGDHKHE